MDSQPQTVAVKRVVLIANYIHDQLQSMDRFANVLSKLLTEAGIKVQVVRPKPIFGTLKPGSNGLGKWLGYIDKWLLFPLSIPSVVRQCKGEGTVFHVLDHSNAPYLKCLQSVPALITCHDLLAIRSAVDEVPENKTRWTGRQLQAIIAKSLKKAVHVACVSEATLQDFQRLFPKSQATLRHMPMCLNATFRELSDGELNCRLSSLKPQAVDGSPTEYSVKNRRYFLHVGSNAWYKNRIGLLHAYAKARVALREEQCCLVFVGPPLSAEQLTFVREGNFADEILIIDNATHTELEALYNGATAFVFPSLAEGFGWPPVEAQACGSIVITSDQEPMLSVSGPAALHVDPRDAEALAAAIVKASKLNESEREKLTRISQQHLLQFAPATMVERYLDYYGNLLAGQ